MSMTNQGQESSRLSAAPEPETEVPSSVRVFLADNIAKQMYLHELNQKKKGGHLTSLHASSIE